MPSRNNDNTFLPPEAFGLDEHQQYKIHAAMQYWQQFPPDEFIHRFCHDVINKQGITLGFMSILRDDPRIQDLALSENYTLRDAIEAVLRGTQDTIDFFEIARELLLQAVGESPRPGEDSAMDDPDFPLDSEFIT